MDQIIPGLWIGDLACALATDYLATAGITHIVTAMKQALPAPIKLPDGRVIDESHIFNIHLDDVDNAPILVHFPGAVEFIDNVLQQEWLEDDDVDGEASAHANEQGDEEEVDITGRAYRPPDKKPGQWATMGEGSVLVHCHAGISRSVAVTCAYLMHTRHMSAEDALKLVQSRRGIASPNPGFMHQLELYESGGYEVDVRHQRTRRFLMSQASILRGNPIDDVMLSYYPSPLHSPAASLSGSSSHGGLGEALQFSSIDGDKDGQMSASSSQRGRKEGSAASSASDGSGSNSRVMSRQNSRAAVSSAAAQLSLERLKSSPKGDKEDLPSVGRTSEGSDGSARSEGTSNKGPRTRAPSIAALSKSPPIGSQAGELFDRSDEPGIYDALTEELIKETFTSISDPREVKVTVSNGSLPGGVAHVRGNEGRVSDKNQSAPRARQLQQVNQEKLPRPQYGAQKLRCKKCRRELAARDHVVEHEPGRGKDAFDVRKRQKDVEQKSRDGRAALGGEGMGGSIDGAEQGVSGDADALVDGAKSESTASTAAQGSSREFKSASSLSASLPPQLAALRLGRGQPPQTQSVGAGSSAASSNATTPAARPSPQPSMPAAAAPSRRMLHSPLCTSYFVEPLAWMSALQTGEVAGRLDCPSTRCGAKLGSWDWAGMQCACGAWVTPAFALHKSKVDEV